MLADDLIATFCAAQAAFGERVHAVAPVQWQLDTPDAQWTVADLVGHLVDEHRWAAPLLAGLDMGSGHRRPDARRHVRRACRSRYRHAGHRPPGRADRPSSALGVNGAAITSSRRTG